MSAALRNVIARLRAAPQPLGIAVSGGSDSAGLMRAAVAAGLKPQIVTVDHGLRPESRAEAEGVAEAARLLGLSHDILEWTDWSGQGNLQDAARRARQRLIGAWAAEREIPVVALGHTQDDQAETVLMRLSRASGVDGLSAMPEWREAYWGHWWRPMLECPRQDIRDWLSQSDVSWVDDPSNENERFTRVKMRKAMPLLTELGIGPDVLAQVALHQQQARDALEEITSDLAAQIATVDGGLLELQAEPLWAAPTEISRRLILAALRWIAPAPYAPRSDAVEGAIANLRDEQPTTLAGCALRPRKGAIAIFREYNAVRDTVATPPALWDGVWQAIPPAGAEPAEIRALGPEGMRQLPDGRPDTRPYAALIAEPAVWKNDRLIAAPMAGWACGWQINREIGADDFTQSILSH
ncbi:tRNA lysidine(34) synthetase TilS [Donghicola sp.]|uniref:tRNA lysidine(34) synthetase TilS n=1 Tax=Donghicola sp. TaxID=1929294 RepID=UPI0025F2DE55|nr:tRNA lysidine(34) synthetase TilS [Donghicola sp.]MCT4575832.1 tRNA lysidine(34) synthetase TilS [Donghicola sp.]